jgi:hypothetical protein
VGVRVETLKQLAQRVGISLRQARHLVQIGKLHHVMIGCRVHVPEGAWERFNADNTVTVWPDVTKGHDCGGLPSVNASTSPGQNAAAAASARLARQTANKLKASSPSGSTVEDADPAQVIQLRSS